MNYLYGWNPVAEFVLDELEARGEKLFSIIVDDAYMRDTNCPRNIKVLAASEVIFNAKDIVINCIGYKDLYKRIKIGEHLNGLGVLKSFVSQKAQIHNSAEIGNGAVFVGNVVVERGCKIGKHGLFWGGSRICHDSTIDQGVFLAAGAIIGGGCTVGQTCSLGFNSSMREKSVMPAGLKVGANTFWRLEQ